MIPIGTVTWLADKLMQRKRGNKAALREKWDRVADYFDQIANCLESMIIKFRTKGIPRSEGNQLIVLLRQFAPIVHSIYSKEEDKDKQQVHQMLSELYQTTERANMLDFSYQNQDRKHPFSIREREEWIADMERIVGRYKGLAAALRASTPESS